MGGRSAAFLPVSTIGGVLRQDAPGGGAAADGGAGGASARRGANMSNASSSMAGIMGAGPGGASSSSSSAGPRSPSNPLKREQPLGGRGLIPLGGLDQPVRPDVVGMRVVPAHARSQVQFG